jgi:hypothetical protein
MSENTLLDLQQIKSSTGGYANLKEQLEFGRFNSVKSGAAPTLYQEFVAAAAQREFTIVNTYSIGDHSLMVLVNGQMMRQGEDNDYIEVNNKTIRFNFDLDAGDVVVMRVNGGTSGPLLHERHIASAGQDLVELYGSYEMGNDSLLVFIDGAYQTLGVDYQEATTKSIQLVEPLEAGSLITFRVEGLPTIITQYANTTSISVYNNDGFIVRETTTGDSSIIKEFEYDTAGLPKRMIIREAGFITTRAYTWQDGQCTHVEQQVQGGL